MRIRTAAPWVLALLVLVIPRPAESQGGTTKVFLRSVQIHQVPQAPNGGNWDGILVNILSLGVGMFPDIEICVGSRSACRLVCINAQLHPDPGNGIEPTDCSLTLTNGLPIAALMQAKDQPLKRTSRDVGFEVNEIEENGNRSTRRPMARFSLFAGPRPVLPTPEDCTPEKTPCRVSIPTDRGPLIMTFTTSTTYEGVLGTPSLPGAPPGKPLPKPGLWDQTKGYAQNAWDRTVEFVDSISPSDWIQAACTARGGIAGWLCGHFIGDTVEKMSDARERRIGCLTEKLGSDRAKTCATIKEPAALESCLLKKFGIDDPVPAACMQSAPSIPST